MTDFLIKSTVSMGILLAIYLLFLEKEKMHRFNRFYLPFALVFSLALPFITIPIYVDVIPKAEAYTTIVNAPIVSHVQVSESTVSLPETDYLLYVRWGVYAIISIILCVRLFINIVRFYRLKKHNENVKYNNATIVLLEYDVLPHTFMNTIYMNKNEYNNSSSTPEILTHEMVHVNQKHSLDILFIEALKALMWFNPLLYIYKKAIQLNHEFLADDATINQHLNISTYQQLLLDKARYTDTYLASSINFGVTKKRFTMMTKTTSKLKIVMIKLGIAPILTALTLFFSVKTIAQEINVSDIDVNSINSIEVTSVTEDEMETLKSTGEIAFEEGKTENYKRIKYTYLDDRGETATKVSYEKVPSKKAPFKMMPVYPEIDNVEVTNIEMKKFTDTQMDSLRLAKPNWFRDDKNLRYEGALFKYTYKNGAVIEKIGYQEVDNEGGKLNIENTQQGAVNKNTTSTITVVEQQPEYNGGYLAFQKYIEDNFSYKNSGKIGVGLKLVYDFNVNEEGKISDIKIESSTVVPMTEEIKAKIPAIEKQLTDLIKTAPGKWKPAKKDGKPVKAKIGMPFYIIANL